MIRRSGTRERFVLAAKVRCGFPLPLSPVKRGPTATPHAAHFGKDAIHSMSSRTPSASGMREPIGGI
jgi:hypothetical protein